jgi:hypothetical protein
VLTCNLNAFFCILFSVESIRKLNNEFLPSSKIYNEGKQIQCVCERERVCVCVCVRARECVCVCVFT